MRILKLVLALMSVAFLFKQVPAQLDQSKEKLPVSIEDLRKAPAEIVIDGKSLSLSTYVGRDFSPGSSPGGRPLLVSVKVATSDKQAFPSRVRIDRVWVLFGEQIWSSDIRGVPLDPSNNNNKEGYIYCSDSPVCGISVNANAQWNPGVFVDVVVRLIDKQGKHHLIQARNQEIKSSS